MSNYGNSFQRVTPAVTNLIIINAIVYVAQLVLGGPDMRQAFDLFALHHYKAAEFNLYQLVTSMFMHGDFLHLLFNMYALWMFGTIVERVWGPKRFLGFYFACGLAASVAQTGMYMYRFWDIDHSLLSAIDTERYMEILRNYATVGASGAIMGVLVAFAYLFPNTEMMIIPIPVPLKAKWVVGIFIAIDLFSGISNNPNDRVAHFAHLGGAIAGFLIVFFQNRNNKRTFY